MLDGGMLTAKRWDSIYSQSGNVLFPIWEYLVSNKDKLWIVVAFGRTKVEIEVAGRQRSTKFRFFENNLLNLKTFAIFAPKL